MRAGWEFLAEWMAAAGVHACYSRMDHMARIGGMYPQIDMRHAHAWHIGYLVERAAREAAV
jgi:hypothetical protein